MERRERERQFAGESTISYSMCNCWCKSNSAGKYCPYVVFLYQRCVYLSMLIWAAYIGGYTWVHTSFQRWGPGAIPSCDWQGTSLSFLFSSLEVQGFPPEVASSLCNSAFKHLIHPVNSFSTGDGLTGVCGSGWARLMLLASSFFGDTFHPACSYL